MRTNSSGRRKLRLPRTIFVTGKGGTGKSTIARALAIAIGRARRTTLLELNPQRIVANDRDPLQEEPANGEVDYQGLGARDELEAFIERIVPVRMIARRMIRSRTFGLVTAALPGLEAFLMLERIRLMAVAAAPDRSIVIDAPATGGALEMLSVADGVKRIAPFGTLYRLAAEVAQFIEDGERFAVVLTSHAEELAVRETISAAEALGARGIRCAGVVLNCVSEVMFSAAEVGQLSGLKAHQALAETRRATAMAAARAHRELRRAGLAVVATPMLYRARLGRPELHRLADVIAEDWGWP